jgi:hypothetical protein
MKKVLFLILAVVLIFGTTVPLCSCNIFKNKDDSGNVTKGELIQEHGLVSDPIITPSLTPAASEPAKTTASVQILTGKFQGVEWGDFMHVNIRGEDGVDYSFFVLQSFDIDFETIKTGQAVKASWQNSDVQLGEPYGINNVDQIIDIELLEPVL